MYRERFSRPIRQAGDPHDLVADGLHDTRGCPGVARTQQERSAESKVPRADSVLSFDQDRSDLVAILSEYQVPARLK